MNYNPFKMADQVKLRNQYVGTHNNSGKFQILIDFKNESASGWKDDSMSSSWLQTVTQEST